MKIINIIKLLTLSILLLSSTLILAQEDPATAGPFSVLTADYNRGDLAFRPSGFPASVEVRARVHYPSDLSQGNFPLVIFLHGRHVTCLEEDIQDDGSGGDDVTYSSFFQWPCSRRRSSIPSYRGYDYVANILASHGYIVASISANGINARDSQIAEFDGGANARARLIQHHLDIWNGFNTNSSGEFGNLFLGKVDMNNVGTMGHSRGGEGVAANVIFNNSLGSPYGIQAVLPLAPTNGNRFLLNDVALGVILPYCDGDVRNLEGVHYYDDARYSSETDNTAKHTFLMMGANHNFFNTIWTPGFFPPIQADNETQVTGDGGAVDDFGGSIDSSCGTFAPGNQRLSSAQQRGVATAYITAFFRTYLGKETQFEALLNGDSLPPSSALGAEVRASYHAPSSERLDLNRLDSETTELINTLGAAATQNGLVTYDICGDDTSERHCLNLAENQAPRQSQQPHTTISAFSDALGLSQLELQWNDNSDSYSNTIPADQSDFRTYEHLQFRAGVNFVDSPNALEQDFQVELWDASGNVSSIRVSDVSDALFYPPGTRANGNPIPKLFLNTIRVPLALYSGIDKSNIAEVRFTFGETTQGAVSISDLALAGQTVTAPVITSDNFTDSRYRLRWRLVNGATHYEWRLNQGSLQSESANTTRTSRMDLNVGDNTFDLRACNASGCGEFATINVEYRRNSPFLPRLDVSYDGGGDGRDSSDEEDYTFSWRSDSQVSYYRLRLNEENWVNIGLVHSTSVGPLIIGSNAVDLRACNEGGCSEVARIYVTFYGEED